MWVDYWGTKGYVAPLSNYWGAAPPPPCRPPLPTPMIFLRLFLLSVLNLSDATEIYGHMSGSKGNCIHMFRIHTWSHGKMCLNAKKNL